PPGDVAALADALQKLLTNPNLHAQLQRGAQTAALQLPTWTDTAKVVADVITQGQTQPWPH
ncbi:MAG TPA: hypothetical protein VLC79_05000, partial [Cellvibrio sp.]|nr:hypothetical protein [Cellvibrio sp.]